MRRDFSGRTMRLIETLFSVVLIAAFAGICASALPSVQQLFWETTTLADEFACDRFIAHSFSRLCEKNPGQAEIDEWCALCTALWHLERLSVSRAGFDANGLRIFCCTWTTAQSEKKAYAKQGDFTKEAHIKEEL